MVGEPRLPPQAPIQGRGGLWSGTSLAYGCNFGIGVHSIAYSSRLIFEKLFLLAEKEGTEEAGVGERKTAPAPHSLPMIPKRDSSDGVPG